MKSEDKKLITVYKAMGQPEAEIVRGRLEVAGIPSVLKYESLGAVYGFTVDGLGQVEVQVPLAYEEAARKLLASPPGEPEE